MEKSKLGIPNFILGAVFYLLCWLGGYIPALLLGGYILIRETDADVRTAAVTGFAVMLAFSLLNVIFGFFPDMVASLQDLLNTLRLDISLSDVYDAFKGFQDFVNFLGDALLVVLAALMFFKKPVSLAGLKKLAN